MGIFKLGIFVDEILAHLVIDSLHVALGVVAPWGAFVMVRLDDEIKWRDPLG